MSKKGQYFSFDAIIATVIFMMAIVLLLSYWHSVKLFLDYQTSDVSKETMRIASLLFVPAFPEGADCSDVENLGFANTWEDKRIRNDLLECARSDSGWLNEKLGSPYNLSIRVTNVDDETWYYIGGGIPSEATEVSNLRRAATILYEDGNTSLAVFDISVYK